MSILEALGRMLGLDPRNVVDRPEILRRTSHIHIIDEGRVSIQEMPAEVAYIERTHHVKIQIVGMDYLQITPVFDENRAGQYITNISHSTETIARLLPEIAKKNKWLCIIPIQPTKSVEGGGRVILLPDSGKGGRQKLVA